jgi:hypothetical protein
MNKKTFLGGAMGIFILLLAQLSCNDTRISVTSSPVPSTQKNNGNLAVSPTTTSTPLEPTVTSTPVSTSTPIPTATLDFIVPTPAPTTSTVIGKVTWNNEPVQKNVVKLCEDFDYTSCLGQEYSTNTNKQGYFLFKNIKPGSYVLLVNLNSTSFWIFNTTDKHTPAKNIILADQVTYLREQQVYKLDLLIEKPISRKVILDNPLTRKVISDKQPKIQWEEYPNAKYYILFLKDSEGREISKTTEKNEFILDEPLIDCQYQLTVKAYNEENMEISENPYYDFIVDNEPLVSCDMKVISPIGDWLDGTKDILLEWEAHPLAKYYIISIKNALGETILEDTKLDKNQTNYTVSFASGEYDWRVTAYDSLGKKLTFTGSRFEIKYKPKPNKAK